MKTSNYLYSLWLRQLLDEFEQICCQYRVHLAPPLFEISESKRHLGTWEPESRTISLSSQLIANHSWAVTINVLKHEMAHQVCSELLGSQQAPHGTDFHRACQALGLPEEFRRSGGDLPEVLETLTASNPATAKGRQLIGRVSKLMALASSSNEHEATLAMQKANELIEKYNLEEINEHHPSSYTSVTINHKKKRIEAWQRRICGILNNFFFVQPVLSSLYDPLSDQTHKTIELLGTSENVVVAEYCYHFLENQIHSLWLQNRHRFKGKTRTEKNSFFLGILSGFYEKLELQSSSSAAAKKVPVNGQTVSALVVSDDQGLGEFVGMKFPRLRTVRRSGPRIYKNTYEHGEQAGRQLNLHKGVSSSDGNLGRLLE